MLKIGIQTFQKVLYKMASKSHVFSVISVMYLVFSVISVAQQENDFYMKTFRNVTRGRRVAVFK